MSPSSINVAAAGALADAPEGHVVTGSFSLRRLPPCRQADRKRIQSPAGSACRPVQPDDI